MAREMRAFFTKACALPGGPAQQAFRRAAGFKRRLAAIVFTNTADLLILRVMNSGSIDLIGDVHGRCRELRTLLCSLGYQESDGAFAHPQRSAVFCGDLIDRGPDTPGTLRLVKAMVDRGSAQTVLGNHEFATVCFAYLGADGLALRRNEGSAFARYSETRAQFSESPAEFEAFIEWFRSWPLSLEISGVRVVHAAWCDDAIACVGTRSLREDAFLRAACAGGSPERAALRTLLRGRQLRLPANRVWFDPQGRRREKIRLKWWLGAEVRRSLSAWALPSWDNLPEEAVEPPKNSECFTAYPSAGAPPVFFGHYRLTGRPEPFGNVACLDYSGPPDSVLTAYRWDGEGELSAQKFVTVPLQQAPPPYACSFASPNVPS